MSFADHVTKSRRLALLRVLVENDGSANESVARTALAALGFAGRLGTFEAVREDIKFLAQCGLVKEDWYGGRVLVASITKRGVAYTLREVDPIEGVDYPAMGV